MPLDLDHLLSAPLPSGTKGLPRLPRGFSVKDIAAQGWNLLAGDVPLPAAIIRTSALDNNLRVMQAYLDDAGVRLAPHGKTTMCPQLYERQIDGGAWGITVATVSQLMVAHDAGVARILIANEVMGPAETAVLAQLSAERPESAYYVLVDSLEGVRQLQEAFAGEAKAPKARLLIEIGMAGGRCGVRNSGDGLALARTVADCDRLTLCGIEGYEGLIVGPDPKADAPKVEAYLQTVLDVFKQCRDQGLFDEADEVLLSAGGSVYFDLVAHMFAGDATPPVVPLVRSGCYLTHDSGFYRRLLAEVDRRDVLGSAPRLLPALEVWARVLSTPEPGWAILSAGKRDLSFDIDLPEPLWHAKPGGQPQAVSGWRIDRLSDQHAFLHTPDGDCPAVGDLIGLGISHPCTTFDKWPVLLEVDDAYTVTGGLKTFF